MLRNKTGKEGCLENGFALLEYCAGAAIIAGVIWVALANFGGSLSGLFNNLSAWAQSRSGDIQNGGSPGTGSQTNN